MVKRFEIYLFNLDANSADDAKNTRPCVVISPDEMNKHIESVVIAPISTVDKNYPTRINFDFLNKKRTVVLDQIRTVDKSRLVKKIGETKGSTKRKVLDVLQEMFSM
ncbi:MAG: type II toxin-antitoxin system PemK/MazF family toxin [Acidobacteriota bacterium]|jgi:mRNA interferase MazF|nr:type II toxin-antitoxin system PemK/MazF family toxin [Acidobacteriota bacterium]